MGLKNLFKKNKVMGMSDFQSPGEIKKNFGVYKNVSDTAEDIIGLMPSGECVTFKKKDYEVGREINDIYFGGAGSGKTACIVKPKILQSIKDGKSIICTVRGDVYDDTASAAKQAGYKIKVLDLRSAGLSRSDKFDPLKGIPTDDYTLRIVVDTIFRDTGASRGTDPFWEESEKLLLKTIMLYLCTDENEIKARHNNLPSVLEFLTKTDVSDYEEIFTKGRDDEDPVVKCYKAFAEHSDAKTIRQMPMSLYSRMQMLSGDNIKTLLSEDDFDGNVFTEEKTICYIEIPETDSSLSVIAALFISIMIHRMYPIYDDKKVSVRFILDELALIGPIYEFVENLAVARFQFTLIFQSIVQAKYLYPDNWEVVVGNCRGMGFLAPLIDTPTVEFVSKILGSTTVVGDGQLVDKKRFMDEKAIEKMESDKILFVRYGENPILLKKYYAH